MKMINDMDMYFADAYAKTTLPAWMKAERIDYCDQKTIGHRAGSFLRAAFSKKAN